MCPAQTVQIIFKLRTFCRMMLAWQCGQGIFSPKKLVGNSMYPPQAVQEIFRVRTKTAGLRVGGLGWTKKTTYTEIFTKPIVIGLPEFLAINRAVHSFPVQSQNTAAKLPASR